MKWVLAICISAVFLTGCGSVGDRDAWNKIDSNLYWRCIGGDKIYAMTGNGIAVSPNSPDCS